MKLAQSWENFQMELVAIRHHLHQHPEVGMALPQTKAFVWQKLVELGYEPKACGQTGITCTVGQGEKVFLLRADMDALPMKELTELPYKSSNEFMHACGHDLHTTMLLGAAKLLKENEDQLTGTVKLFFQPGEEILSGAFDCLAHGLLTDPKVDAGAMMHVFPYQDQEIGQLFIAPGGTFMASADWFEIRVEGVGGHGSTPEFAIDPINVATKIYEGLQTLSAREISSKERFVLTVGEFQAGSPGSSNVIPNEAVLKGTLRTLDEAVRKKIKARMQEIGQRIGQAFQAKVEVVFTNGCRSNQIDPVLAQLVTEHFNATFTDQMMGLEDFSHDVPLMGSEDFGEISHQIPTVTLLLSAAKTDLMLHNPRIELADEVLTLGAKAYVECAYSYFTAQNEVTAKQFKVGAAHDG